MQNRIAMKTRITFILALLLLVLTGKAQTEVYLKGNIVPDGSVLLGYRTDSSGSRK